MATYDEIQIGQTAELKHKITQEDINKFIDLTGDDNKLHTDSEFAAKTSFKKPVAHGMLGATFISTIIGTKLPGDGALWYSQNLEFLSPVRVGDSLTIRAEVISKDDRQQAIELKTDIINQDRKVVTRGFSKVKILKQEDPKVEGDNHSLEKKVALVAGASGGIGSEVCLELAKQGFDIVVHYFHNESSANLLAESILKLGRKVYVCSCDIADQIAVNEMVEQSVRHLGGITALVNCATYKVAAIKFTDLVWDDFENHINMQLLGTFNLVHAVLPGMEKTGYGKIINIDTQYVDAPEANLLPYIAAKSALRGFSKSLAHDLAVKGIRVNSVSPGMADTDLIADVPERVRLVTAAKTPLKRLATANDIAKTIVFLASEQSDFLCGETIRVNGGQVMI